ncbi:MAG: RHS repeat protein [Verrucomicrobiaceae bacterium]|nr:RHS repeat protein [Verrucomicrobiaceae bacterium]
MNTTFSERKKPWMVRFRQSIFVYPVVGCIISTQAMGEPEWWAQHGVLNPSASRNDFAAINIGQLKAFALAARDKMNISLPGGAGEDIENLIASWNLNQASAMDFAAANLGQAKNLAGMFQARLQAFGVHLPPGLPAGFGMNDYSVATIGQVKGLFNFEIPQLSPTQNVNLGEQVNWADPESVAQLFSQDWMSSAIVPPPVASGNGAEEQVSQGATPQITHTTITQRLDDYVELGKSIRKSFLPAKIPASLIPNLTDRGKKRVTTNPFTSRFTGLTKMKELAIWDKPRGGSNPEDGAYPTPSPGDWRKPNDGSQPEKVYYYLLYGTPQSFSWVAGKTQDVSAEFYTPSWFDINENGTYDEGESWTKMNHGAGEFAWVDLNGDGQWELEPGVPDEREMFEVPGPQLFTNDHAETNWRATWTSFPDFNSATIGWSVEEGSAPYWTNPAISWPDVRAKAERAYKVKELGAGGLRSGGDVAENFVRWYYNDLSWYTDLAQIPDPLPEPPYSFSSTASKTVERRSAAAQIVCSSDPEPETLGDIVSSLAASPTPIAAHYKIREHTLSKYEGEEDPTEDSNYIGSLRLFLRQGSTWGDQEFLATKTERTQGSQLAWVTLEYDTHEVLPADPTESEPNEPPSDNDEAGADTLNLPQVRPHLLSGSAGRSVSFSGVPIHEQTSQKQGQVVGVESMTGAVDTFSGRLSLSAIDLNASTGTTGMPLRMVRTLVPAVWHEKTVQPWSNPALPLGAGWTTSIAPVLVKSNTEGTTTVTLTDYHGSALSFRQVGGEYELEPWSTISATEALSELTESSTEYIYTRNNGERMVYSKTAVRRTIGLGPKSTTMDYARMVRAEDGRGNSLVYNYKTGDALIPSTISDPLREAHRLIITIGKNGKIERVANSAGHECKYTYTTVPLRAGGVPLLATVTQPMDRVLYHGYDVGAESLTLDGSGSRACYHVDLAGISNGVGEKLEFEWASNNRYRQTVAYPGTDKNTYTNFVVPGYPRMVKTIKQDAKQLMALNNTLVVTTVVAKDRAPVLHAGPGAVTVTDASGANTRVWSFEEPSQVTAFTNPSSVDVVCSLSKTRVISPLGYETWRFDRGAGMALAEHVSTNGKAETASYGDELPAPKKWEGLFERFEQPTVVSNAALEATTVTYDAKRNPIELKSPTGKTVITRTPQGFVTSLARVSPSNVELASQTRRYESTFPGVVTTIINHRASSDPDWCKDRKTTFFPNNTGRIIKVVEGSALNPVTTHYTYTTYGQVASKRDARGYLTNYTYDSGGRLTKVELPPLANGRPTYSTFYDNAGRVTAAVEPDGTPTLYDYSSVNGNLERITVDLDWDGVAETTDSGSAINYDVLGRPIRFSDPTNVTILVSYDKAGRVISAGPSEMEFEFEYAQSSNWVTRVIDPRDFTTSIDYDDLGRPVAMEKAYQTYPTLKTSRTSITYDGFGKVSGLVNNLNQATIMRRDALGKVVEVVTPDNRSSFVKHTVFGDPYEWRDHDNALLATAEYDELGRRLKVRLESPAPGSPGGTIEYSYDELGNIVSVKDLMGGLTSHKYDAAGRLVQTSLPSAPDGLSGNAKRSTYSTSYTLAGRISKKTDALGNSTIYRYDALGQLGQIEFPGARIADSASPTFVTFITFQRDLAGRVKSVMDQNGLVTSYGYDTFGRQESITRPDGSTTKVQLDPVGNVTQVIDGLGKKTLLQYDGFGRRVSMTRPGATKSSVWEYDSHRLLRMREAGATSDSVLVEEHDNLNRVIREKVGAARRTYAYDASGNLLSVTDSADAKKNVSYTYDKWDRLATETSNGVTFVHQNDLLGNRTSTVSSSGLSLFRTFDSLGRLSVQTEGDRVTKWRYNANDQVIRQELPSGLITDYSYDKLGRMTSQVIQVRTPAQVSLYSVVYSFDAAGNVRFVDERSPNKSWGGASRRLRSVGYDKAYRMTDEILQQSPVSTGTWTEWRASTYTYDRGDRRTTREFRTQNGLEESSVYEYDTGGLNQLRKITETSTGQVTKLAYHSVTGNLTSYQTGSTITHRFEYDDEGNLKKLTTPEGIQQFTTDYRGRRITRTAEGVTTNISYMGQQSAVEWNTTASVPERQMVRGVGMEGGVGGLTYVLEGSSSPEPILAHHNGRGDVIATTSANRSLTSLRTYDGFGKPTTLTQGSAPVRMAASSKEADTPNFLHEGFRERDIDTGLFLTPDPMEFIDGTNTYAYVKHNPFSAFDPYGLWTWGGVLGVAAGAAVAGLAVGALMAGAPALLAGLGMLAAAKAVGIGMAVVGVGLTVHAVKSTVDAASALANDDGSLTEEERDDYVYEIAGNVGGLIGGLGGAKIGSRLGSRVGAALKAKGGNTAPNSRGGSRTRQDPEYEGGEFVDEGGYGTQLPLPPPRPKGSNHPNTQKASRTGINYHNDKDLGAKQTDQMFPKTVFDYGPGKRRGPDVIYESGIHPSDYPGSKWPKGVNHGDWKPDTPGGRKTFKSDQKHKWSMPVHQLPYDPAALTLRPQIIPPTPPPAPPPTPPPPPIVPPPPGQPPVVPVIDLDAPVVSTTPVSY